MRTLLNIIWVVFGGLWLFLSYLLFGLIACLLIVTIPAGVASFRIAAYVLWPLGREGVPAPRAGAHGAHSSSVRPSAPRRSTTPLTACARPGGAAAGEGAAGGSGKTGRCGRGVSLMTPR